MAYNIPNFLKRNGDALLFNGEGEFIFYVPEEYFGETSKSAIINGNYVSMMGLCNYTILDKNGKSNGFHKFSHPTVITCKPYTIDKIKQFKMNSFQEPSDYRLLKFQKDDEVITNVRTAEDIINVEVFFSMFYITGKIPNTIPYDRLHQLFVDNADLNGFSYDINMQLFGVTLTEMCRDPKDISKPFRLSKIDDMHDYNLVSIKKIPNYISPYVSFTSEYFDESLMSAIITKDDKYSPLEKVLTR